MVRVKLPELQLKAESSCPVHTTINVHCQGMGRSSSRFNPASFPEQPQMNGGKERKENLNVSNLCLAENAGLPKQDIANRILYGNGVTIVPNVQAVMAWAARKILAV